jgi:hypothetical protein
MHSTDDLDDGYLGSGVRLVRSLKKHGKEQHNRETLFNCESRQEASDKEKELITEEVRSDPLSMNCAPGGMGAVDRPATKDETRAKLSIASKRAVRTKEWYEKVVATRRVKNSYQHSEETLRKISTQHKGKTLSDEHKANISAGNKGRVLSEEVRSKISASIKANSAAGLRKNSKPKSAEHREKLRQAQLGRKYSEESRRKMSEKAKARCERQRLDKVQA